MIGVGLERELADQPDAEPLLGGDAGLVGARLLQHRVGDARMAFGVAGDGDAGDSIFGEQAGLEKLQRRIERAGRIVAIAADDMGAVDSGLGREPREHPVQCRLVRNVAGDDVRDRDHVRLVQPDRGGDHVVGRVARHGGDEHARLRAQDVGGGVERLVIAGGELGRIIVEQPRQGGPRFAITGDRRHVRHLGLCEQ